LPKRSNASIARGYEEFFRERQAGAPPLAKAGSGLLLNLSATPGGVVGSSLNSPDGASA